MERCVARKDRSRSVNESHLFLILVISFSCRILGLYQTCTRIREYFKFAKVSEILESKNVDVDGEVYLLLTRALVVTMAKNMRQSYKEMHFMNGD